MDQRIIILAGMHVQHPAHHKLVERIDQISVGRDCLDQPADLAALNVDSTQPVPLPAPAPVPARPLCTLLRSAGLL